MLRGRNLHYPVSVSIVRFLTVKEVTLENYSISGAFMLYLSIFTSQQPDVTIIHCTWLLRDK
jgi:hypothetical protein